MNATFCTHCGTAIEPTSAFCTSCGKAVAGGQQHSRGNEAVPSAARAPNRRTMTRAAKIAYSTGALALGGVFLWLFVDHLPGGAHPVIERQPSIAMATMNMGQTINGHRIPTVVQNDAIVFTLADLLAYKLVEFEYQEGSTTIPLLAYISAEGKLVTAIRICEPCNSNTFRIEGTEMVCGKCGTRWKLNNLEGLEGSCQKYPPDPIPSEVIGNQVRIGLATVRNWKMRI